LNDAAGAAFFSFAFFVAAVASFSARVKPASPFSSRGSAFVAA
jgi:hypothetical protein